MSNQPEIYCFIDSEYKDNIDSSIDLLRKHGYRVVVGTDIKELLLLLEIGDPVAIVYTLVSDSSSLERSFQSIASNALERSVPMFLIGPEDSRKGFHLYYPLDPYFDGKQVDAVMLASVLDDIHGTSNAVPWEAANSEPVPRKKLVDSFEDGEESVRIETSVMLDEEPKITTVVYRRGEMVVREEQAVRVDEPDLTHKIEAQHLSAVGSYAPAPPRPRRKYPGKVNAPIVQARIEQAKTLETDTWVGDRNIVSKRLLILGMVVFCGVVFYLSTRQVTPIPQPISGPEIVQTDPGSALRGGNPPSEETEPVLNDASPNDGGVENGDGVLFPGRFRPNTTTFGFRNKGEERIFISTIKELSKEKKIRLLVRFKDSNVSDKKRRLGEARANAVFRYLREQGLRRRDVFIGKSTNNTLNRHTRHKIVEQIIDQ
jgi:hypothetical protein